MQRNEADAPRYQHDTWVVARSAPGVDVEDVQSEMTQIATALEAEYPRSNRGRGMFVETVDQVVRGDLRQPMLVLLLAVLVLLAGGCLNIANLSLARASARSQEVSVLALSAPAAVGLVRRFVLESLLFFGLAAVLGVAAAGFALQAIPRLAPDLLESTAGLELRLAPVAVLVPLVVCLAMLLLCALLPAASVHGGHLPRLLRAGGHRASGSRKSLAVRRGLVIAQVAMALTLTTTAVLLVRSLANVESVDPGFSADRVLRASFRLPPSRYPTDLNEYPHWDAIHRFDRALVAAAEALPGVEAAAITTDHPLSRGWTNSFVIVGRETDVAEQGEISVRLVSREYFDTSGLALVAGRRFDVRDGTGEAPVLVLNQSSVERYFPESQHEDAVLGEALAFWGIEREVIGVVADERIHGLESAVPPAAYLPLAQSPHRSSATVMVRTSGDPLAVTPGLVEAVRDIDPAIALHDITTMAATLDEALGRRRFTSLLLTAFALTALTLAILGVYGLMSYNTVRRRQEIGIRMALGARRGQVLWSVLGSGLGLAGLGVAAGVLGSLLVSRLLDGLLFGVEPREPAIYIAAAVALVVSTSLATLLPALRASRVSPVETLGES